MEIVFNKNKTEIGVLPDFITMQSYTKTKDNLVIVFRSAEEIERLMALEQNRKPIYTLDPETIEWMSKRGD
jgi:hypothetical protein